MKCVLCNITSSDSEDLKEHCIDFHKANRDNQFFINLFKGQNNVLHPRKCLRCDEFLLNPQFKVNYNFLVHYGAGRDHFEEKLLNYKCLGEIQNYEITFTQHL